MDKVHYLEVLHSVECGDDAAKTKLAKFLLAGCDGVERNPERAVELLKERVQEKDGEAMWMLGLCCEYGMGTETDFDEAERLYELSSSAENMIGDLFAQFSYGAKGSGVFGVDKICLYPVLICFFLFLHDNYFKCSAFSDFGINIADALLIAPWTHIELLRLKKKRTCSSSNRLLLSFTNEQNVF